MNRWRICDLAHIAGNIRNSHSIIMGLSAQATDRVPMARTSLVSYIPMYIQQHQDATQLLGEIHQDIFYVIKQNGLTFDDIKGYGANGSKGGTGKQLN